MHHVIVYAVVLLTFLHDHSVVLKLGKRFKLSTWHYIMILQTMVHNVSCYDTSYALSLLTFLHDHPVVLQLSKHRLQCKSKCKPSIAHKYPRSC